MLDFEAGDIVQVAEDAADFAEDFASLAGVDAGLREGCGDQ
jgi:hypothetical protein